MSGSVYMERELLADRPALSVLLTGRSLIPQSGSCMTLVPVGVSWLLASMSAGAQRDRVFDPTVQGVFGSSWFLSGCRSLSQECLFLSFACWCR
mmetsp:Transcript_38392/g.94088  ORF Transcript_38392/g.94088 Transcript_38392/m.94088 type:complete len:94 (+) Transcript_38392:17-298(+)